MEEPGRSRDMEEQHNNRDEAMEEPERSRAEVTEEHERNRKKVFDAMTELGFRPEFAYVVSKEMSTNYLSKRMTGYLKAARPRSMEEVADEMVSIIEERNRLADKIENRRYLW